MTKGTKLNPEDPCVTEIDDNVIIEPKENPHLIWEAMPVEGCNSEILNT